MKKKGILLLLVFTMFLTACTQNIELSQRTTEASTNYENDNINIKIAKDMEEKEEIYENTLEDLQKIEDFSPIKNLEIEISKRYTVPNLDKVIKVDDKFIETEEFKKELIKKSYGIYDNWIAEGLYAKIFDMDTEIINFSTYYKNHDFSLFGARFYELFSSEEEIKSVKSASIDLVEYLLNNDKKTELLENNIEISDIENWAKDKNIDLSYQEEIQSLMNRMEVVDKTSKLIINTEEEINGFTIEIDYSDKLNQQYDTAEKIEKIILRFDRDILAIKKGIEKDAPNFYEDYKEVLNNVPKLKYIFDDTINAGGLCYSGSAKIYLKTISIHPHEYCHFLFHDPFVKEGISISKPLWLDEGIVEYLNSVYSEAYGEFMRDNFHDLSDFSTNSLEENLLNDMFQVYKANNINIDNIDNNMKDKNKRSTYHHISWLFSSKWWDMVGDDNDEFAIYSWRGIKSAVMTEGETLGYIKNFSFMHYIIEEYGLEKILYLNVADFSELTYKKVFGKTFKDLEADWINYLKENIKDIELIL